MSKYFLKLNKTILITRSCIEDDNNSKSVIIMRCTYKWKQATCLLFRKLNEVMV